MHSYPEDYLNEVVENQGRLFEFVAEEYPDKDTEDFINSYMAGKTRKNIDEGQAYVATMTAVELWYYFASTENFHLKSGRALDGFMPAWIGQFYAYYQWFYDIPSEELIKMLPLSFVERAYAGLHDVSLEEAVEKVGKIR